MRLAKPLNYSAKSPDRQCHKGNISRQGGPRRPDATTNIKQANRGGARIAARRPTGRASGWRGWRGEYGEAVAFEDAHRGGILWPARGLHAPQFQRAKSLLQRQRDGARGVTAADVLLADAIAQRGLVEVRPRDRPQVDAADDDTVILQQELIRLIGAALARRLLDGSAHRRQIV